jgi:hypothetical protein
MVHCDAPQGNTVQRSGGAVSNSPQLNGCTFPWQSHTGVQVLGGSRQSSGTSRQVPSLSGASQLV